MIAKKTAGLLCFVAGFLMMTEAVAQEKLIFAIDLIRHGDRSPTRDFPNSPYQWPQKIGELSAEGMQQEFQNGVRFRQEYIEKNHLLPKQYLGGTVYVQSTAYNRTLMSANSVLQGLYPLGTGPTLPHSKKAALPGAAQPIPIYTTPKDQDDLLLSDSNHERYVALKKQYVWNQSEWQQKNAEFQPKFKEWSDITGLTINDIDDAIEFGDHLRIRQLHNVPLPAGISDKEAKKIIALSEWCFIHIFKPEIMGATMMHHLLSTMAHYIDDASQHKSPLKYVLFSAHDATILATMSALKAPLTAWPPYASDLKILLFKNDAQYTVKIKLNGKPVMLPACGGSDTCSLQQFLQLANQVEAEGKV